MKHVFNETLCMKWIVPDTKTTEMATMTVMATKAPIKIRIPIFVFSILFETWSKLDWALFCITWTKGLCKCCQLYLFFKIQRICKPFKIVELVWWYMQSKPFILTNIIWWIFLTVENTRLHRDEHDNIDDQHVQVQGWIVVMNA